MTNKILSITLMLSGIVVALSALLAPLAANAQIPSGVIGGDQVQNGLNTAGDAFPSGAKENLSVPDMVHKIINWALYIAAIAAVIFIIIGGYFMIFSAGDPSMRTKGRNTLVNALIGLTVIVLSYIIVQVVYNFLISR